MFSSLRCFWTFSGLSLKRMFSWTNFCSFLAVSKPTSYYNSFDLQCRNTDITLQMNQLIISNKCSLRWRQIYSLVLETNTLILEMNTMKTYVWTTATHTVSYQWLPNITYVEMTASHSYTHLRKWVLPHYWHPQGIYTCTMTSSVALSWYWRPSK